VNERSVLTYPKKILTARQSSTTPTRKAKTTRDGISKVIPTSDLIDRRQRKTTTQARKTK
jgi:hypothetical protein